MLAPGESAQGKRPEYKDIGSARMLTGFAQLVPVKKEKPVKLKKKQGSGRKPRLRE
jgi:hypothetical protein